MFEKEVQQLRRDSKIIAQYTIISTTGRRITVTEVERTRPIPEPPETDLLFRNKRKTKGHESGWK